MFLEPADDIRRLAERAETHARFVREDLDAGDVDRAESSAVAAIDAAVAMRELLGAMAVGTVRVAELIA